MNVKLFRIAEGKVSLRKKGTELLKLGQVREFFSVFGMLTFLFF